MHAPALGPSVVVASEKLDGEDGWRMLAPGELVHVGPDLNVHSTIAVPEPPARPVALPGRQPEHRHLNRDSSLSGTARAYRALPTKSASSKVAPTGFEPALPP